MAPRGGETPRFAQYFDAIVGNVSHVLRGKTDQIELSIIALLAEGHLLIEDVPGVGKTSLAKALAASVHCDWSRVQFTPDLLPSDVIGVSVFQRANEMFSFQKGPLFANIVLADEINRASPKTQSALLEAMEERQVTADGTRYVLDRPFMVLATQNPIEQEGTYRLPESQLDRFSLKISLGYPSRKAHLEILDNRGSNVTLADISPVVSREELLTMIDAVSKVHVAEALKHYLVELTEGTRRHGAVELGLSPRATLQLAAASRAHAAARGLNYVSPDDVKAVAVAALSHRLILRAETGDRFSQEDVIKELLDTVPVPVRR
ncbi:MAG: MoxR family ATPase [Actinomycetota bacterium]|nr:MoxR family ATPase [Actinomycetota bacterium]